MQRCRSQPHSAWLSTSPPGRGGGRGHSGAGCRGVHVRTREMVRCLRCQIGTRLSRRKDLIGSRGVCALSEGAGSGDGIGLFAAVPQLDCGCCALTALLLSSRSCLTDFDARGYSVVQRTTLAIALCGWDRSLFGLSRWRCSACADAAFAVALASVVLLVKAKLCLAFLHIAGYAWKQQQQQQQQHQRQGTISQAPGNRSAAAARRAFSPS